MYKSISLSLNNIDNFRKINKFNSEFSLSNKNFFKQYDNSNIIQKIFLRRNVNLLLQENDYIGYIWFQRLNKYHTSINSINVLGHSNSINFYKVLISSLSNNSLITYECEDNEGNINILRKLGFKRVKGFLELEKKCNEHVNIFVPNKIAFSIVKKDKDEKTRCLIQNEIFKNDDRIPISVEDIYYDEAQEYDFDKGAIFIKLDNVTVSYGQIIVENQITNIVNFGIIEKYRKEGYGKALLKYLLDIAIDNNFPKISLRVDSNNIVAYKLYISLGFNVKKELYTWQKTNV